MGDESAHDSQYIHTYIQVGRRGRIPQVEKSAVDISQKLGCFNIFLDVIKILHFSTF